MPPTTPRLMIALDFPAPAPARHLVEQLSGLDVIYKIGMELIYAGGLELAPRLREDGRQMFLDAKLLDIGNTVEHAAAAIARLGATFLTVHASDRKTMGAAVKGRGDSGMKLLAVTVMTNLTQQDLAEQGIEMQAEQLVLHRAKLAQESGFDGVVASGLEAQRLRAELGPDFLIVTPGIRPSGSDAGDQARVMTPAKAIAAGASHLVVGRPITQSADPRKTTQTILEDIADTMG